MIAFFACLLLAIFLLIGMALLLPVKLIFAAAGDDSGVRADGRLVLFRGLLGLGGYYGPGGSRISVYLGSWKMLDGNAAPIARYFWNISNTPKKKKAPEKPEKERKRFFSECIRGWRRVTRPQFIPWGTVLRELRKLLLVDRFDVRFTFGLGDPALTGQILGILYAVNGILPQRYVIVPAGDFSRRTFSGKADITVTFRTHLFWMLLLRGFLAYLRIRGERRLVTGDGLKAREA